MIEDVELLVLDEVGEELDEDVWVDVGVTELVNVIEGDPEGVRELEGVLDGLVPYPTEIVQVVFVTNVPVDGTWPIIPK